MLFKRFYDDKLAQASYLVGCARTGEAIVVDPNRDIEPYLEAAGAEGVRITAVTETHIHADFVSGLRELAARTGARAYLSDAGDADWKYGFAAEIGARLLRDGDTFMVGNVRFEAIHTPGHTPEHLSFLVTDTAVAGSPMGIFSGDFVFVGDVGRPDLLEKAAQVARTAEPGARTLFRSLQRFKSLPDHLQLWPGHGAGSACGKGLSAVPQSTVGYEKLFNWALTVADEDEFVRQVLAGQPEPPKYFAEMKRINKLGPRVLGGFPRPARLAADRLGGLLASGAVVVDLRPAQAYAEGHVPGTINLPLNRSFNTWAGWLLPYDRDLYLLADARTRPGAVDEAARDLAMVGLDRIAGWFDHDALDAWRERHGLETVEQITPAELAALKAHHGEVAVVDVRGRSEWEAGHLPGVPNLPLGYLPDRLDEIPTDRPVVLHCQGGGRSSIGASLLLARGVKKVRNLSGGYAAWQAAGLPTERGPEPTEAS
ncbi:MAG TPA: rhodanese-like domain-containing protein [Gemmatimonadales bacterium]|nr:rhodanese-like domain-containing protein [Gemmatimonadales bacterium]